MTKLSSSLPKDYEDDGLSSINRELVEKPSDQHMVIMMIDCKSITTEVDTGMEVATARILAIEPMTDGIRIDQAREMMQQAKERRTGVKPLPFEQVDRDTGEISTILTNGVVTFGKGRKK